MTPDRAAPRRIAVAGLVLYAVLVGLLLAARDPTWFVDFGSDEPVSPHAREVFGANVETLGPKGHDGQTFWAIARDPLLLDAKRVAADLDRPAYRTQRMLYPALVAPWRLAGEQPMLWGLIVTNLAVVLFGGYVTTLLAQEVGAPSRAGLAFALNPLVVMSVVMDVADALALAMLVAFVLAVARRKPGWAYAAGALAVLAKESSLIVIVGVAVLAPGLALARRIRLAGIPATVGVVWALYSRWRLGWPASEIHEFSWVPFDGFRDAVRFYYPDRSSVWDLTVSFALIPLAAWIVWRWSRRRTLVMAAALPSALMLAFLAAPVLYLPINSVRAMGAAITFLVIDLYASGMIDSRHARETTAPWRDEPLLS